MVRLGAYYSYAEFENDRKIIFIDNKTLFMIVC